MKSFAFGLVILLNVSSVVGAAPTEHPVADVMNQQKLGKAIVVDVREETEVQATGLVDGAVVLPTSEIKAKSQRYQDFMKALDKQKVVLVYCAVGGRSGQFVQTLKSEGFKSENLGGFAALKTAGIATHPWKK